MNNECFTLCLAAGKLAAYAYLPRIEEDEEEEEEEELEATEQALANHLQIILATPSHKSSSPPLVGTIEISTHQSLLNAGQENASDNGVVENQHTAERSDEGRSDIVSELSQDSSDDNMAVTSEDTASLTLQSSAEMVAERVGGATELGLEVEAMSLSMPTEEEEGVAGHASEDGVETSDEGDTLSDSNTSSQGLRGAEEVVLELEEVRAETESPSLPLEKGTEIRERPYQALL